MQGQLEIAAPNHPRLTCVQTVKKKTLTHPFGPGNTFDDADDASNHTLQNPLQTKGAISLTF